MGKYAWMVWAVSWLAVAWLGFSILFRKIDGKDSKEASTALQREHARCAMRVHQQAFLRSPGSARYVQDMDDHWQRVEVLARALAESALSVVLSGTPTGLGEVVIAQIAAAWGHDSAKAVMHDLVMLHELDRKGQKRKAIHPDEAWAMEWLGGADGNH